jgi:hypothetical protein
MHLCRYTIASADMYYSELGLRDVTLRIDELGNFQIVGETSEGDLSTTVGLCEIFLEYAMYCCTWWELDEAFHQMQDFAAHIGHSVGQFLKRNTHLAQFHNPCDCALEHLFQAINAHVSIDYSEGIEHFAVVDCPLEEAAEHSGLRNIELAHYGINIMCQNMIEAINPRVNINTTSEMHPEFVFTILKPEFA